MASATFSFLSMSWLNTLTEFSPLTPLIASSTLSEMYCEKLKTTPGNARDSSPLICSVSFSFVIPRGHSSNRLSGAKNSML